MGTYRHTRTRGRVTSACTWCGSTSGPGTDTHAEQWQRRHVCCPEKLRPASPDRGLGATETRDQPKSVPTHVDPSERLTEPRTATIEEKSC